MPLSDRAAQFAPFSALSGYEAAVEERGRMTDVRIELDESMRTALDNQLQRVREQLDSHPFLVITYFVEDTKKEGGAYVTVSGNVQKMDLYSKTIILSGGEEIPMLDIVKLEWSETDTEFVER
jgi:hypothetical protein